MKTIDEILTDLAQEYKEIKDTGIITVGNVSTFRGKVVGVNLTGEDIWNLKHHFESACICANNEAAEYWHWLAKARYSIRESADTILNEMRKHITYRKRF